LVATCSAISRPLIDERFTPPRPSQDERGIGGRKFDGHEKKRLASQGVSLELAIGSSDRMPALAFW
jgi:hypothetical protein